MLACLQSFLLLLAYYYEDITSLGNVDIFSYSSTKLLLPSNLLAIPLPVYGQLLPKCDLLHTTSNCHLKVILEYNCLCRAMGE